MNMLLLDNDTAPCFSGLYDGDIMEVVSDAHLSFGTFEDDKAVALLVTHVEDSDFFIDWIYTLPEYRNRGIASRLIDQMIESLSSIVTSEELRVLCPGKKMKNYFEGMKFVFDESPAGTLYKAPLKDMAELPVRDNPNCIRLVDVNDKDLRMINNSLDDMGEQAYGIKLPIRRAQYSDISRTCLKDNRLLGLLLLKNDLGNFVDIAYALKTEGSEVPFLCMICEAKKDICQKFPPDSLIRTATLNGSSTTLFKKLFPNAESEDVYYGMRLFE